MYIVDFDYFVFILSCGFIVMILHEWKRLRRLEYDMLWMICAFLFVAFAYVYAIRGEIVNPRDGSAVERHGKLATLPSFWGGILSFQIKKVKCCFRITAILSRRLDPLRLSRCD